MDNNQFRRAMPGPPMPNLDGQKWVSPPRFGDQSGQDDEESSGTPEPRSRPMRGRPRQSRPAGPSKGSPGSSHPVQPPNARPNAPNAQPNSPQGASFRPPRPPQPPQPPQPGSGQPPGRRPAQRPQPPQPPRPVATATSRRVNKKKGSWKGLFFKLFLVYSAFLLLFTCPPTQPLADDMPCLCSKLHNRIDDLRPFYSKHLAAHINPQLERPAVQKVKTVVVPFVHRAVDASSSFYDNKVRPHLESVASKIYTVAEKQAHPHLVKLQPHLSAVSSKAHELKARFVDPVHQKGLQYHEQYGKPVLKRADAFVQTKVRPHVNQAATIGAHHGQLYWAVFRKWFHEHVVLSVAKFYSQTVLPSVDKIRDRLNSRTTSAVQEVAGISIEPFAQEATPEPSATTAMDAVVTPELEVEFGVPEPESLSEQPDAPESTYVEHEVPAVEVHMPEVPEVPEMPEETLLGAEQVASALDSAPEPPTKDIPEEAIEEYIEEQEEVEAEPVIEFNPPVAEPAETAEEPVEPVEEPVEPVEPVEEPVEEPVAEPVAEPVEEPVAEPVKETVEPVGSFEAKGPAAKDKMKRSWIARVDRTAKSALKNLQKDVDASCKDILAESKPQFVKVLREISQYGESKVEELTKVVIGIEGDETVHEDDDIVNEFTAAADHINGLSNDIRNQALVVAEKALERTEELRKQTLEALDDFFDVILLEAGRESVDDDEDEFAKWKEYHQLKEHLNSVRSDVEARDIDMELINNSLREPQQAAVLLAQGFMDHVNSLRAKTQFLVQQRLMQRRAAESKAAEESAAEESGETLATFEASTVEAEPTASEEAGDVVAATPSETEEAVEVDTEDVEEYTQTVTSVRTHTQTIVSEVETEAVIQTVPIEIETEPETTNTYEAEIPEPEVTIQTVPIETTSEEVTNTREAEIPEPEVTIQTVPIETTSEPEVTNTHEADIPEPEVTIQTVPVETTSEPEIVIQTVPIEVESEVEPEVTIQTVPVEKETAEAPIIFMSSQEPAAEPIETLWEERTPPFQYVGAEEPLTVYETQVVTEVVHDDL